MNNFYIQMFFGGFNFTPDGLIRHLHHLGSLVDGSGPLDVFQDVRSTFADDDVVVFINDPLGRS
jgi:hypothetical protein